METTRRSMLKASGVAAVLGMTGLSGCSMLGGGGGGNAATYWYDPASLLETQNKFFGSMDYGSLYEVQENLPESAQSGFEGSADSPVNPEDIDTFTGVGGAQLSMDGSGGGSGVGSMAVLGSFEKSTVQEAITAEGNAQESGEYEGFTLYTQAETVAPGTVGSVPSSASATAAVGEGAMIIGFAGSGGTSAPSVTGEQAARRMIDTTNGNADLLTDTSEYASQLNNRFGGSMVMVGGQIDPAVIEAMGGMGGGGMSGGSMTQGLRAGGFGMDIQGETTSMTAAAIYESAEAAEGTQVVSLVNAFSQRMVEQNPAINSLNANYDGNTVVVTLEADTKTLLEQGTSMGGGTGFDVAAPDPVGFDDL